MMYCYLQREQSTLGTNTNEVISNVGSIEWEGKSAPDMSSYHALPINLRITTINNEYSIR